MERFVDVDRDTPFLFEQDLRDWVPKDHIVHFIIEAVEAISPTVTYHVNERDCGSKQFNPVMMTELLMYSYSTKRFSAYAIEKASYTDIPTMYITCMKHPDHNTINNFRKNNKEAFREVFVKVLLLRDKTRASRKNCRTAF
ncbi:transposase [Treponema peruense]|uniref:Transposase n=1 Tax=Treponema peruense TaxID=2787628 RepID=A0A7T3REL9_9SPIR|nr:transposase [Treponema peruense]QQA01592.1 transposase [Treponema peruense]